MSVNQRDQDVGDQEIKKSGRIRLITWWLLWFEKTKPISK